MTKRKRVGHTMIMMRFGVLAVAFLPGVTTAQNADTAARLADQVSACRTINAADERLACYDRTMTKFDEARKRRDLVVVDRAEMRKARESLFGFTLPKIKLFGRTADGSDGAEVKEITSTVTAIEPVGYKLFQWHLADGSTWQTLEGITRNSFVKKGASITVTAVMMGGYRAKVNGSAVPVKRVR